MWTLNSLSMRVNFQFIVSETVLLVAVILTVTVLPSHSANASEWIQCTNEHLHELITNALRSMCARVYRTITAARKHSHTNPFTFTKQTNAKPNETKKKKIVNFSTASLAIGTLCAWLRPISFGGVVFHTSYDTNATTHYGATVMFGEFSLDFFFLLFFWTDDERRLYSMIFRMFCGSNLQRPCGDGEFFFSRESTKRIHGLRDTVIRPKVATLRYTH